jgi:cytochrome c5
MSSSGVPAPGAGRSVATVASPTPSARPAASNGLFTSAQAARGEQYFKRTCATCHSIEEQTGSLRAKWGNGTLCDLYAAIATTMPQNNPGGLTADEYASILAFYLQHSGHAPGTTELPSDPEALAQMRLAP